MTHRILITGASGFVGGVLTPLLQREGYYVTALSNRLQPCPGQPGSYIRCDINDASAVAAAVLQTQPTHIIHLAAISNVPASFTDPLSTWRTNVTGSMHLLEAARLHAPDAFMLFASSAEVYGASFRDGIALDEQSQCQPMNPYSASKLAAECAFAQYFRQGAKGIIARPFNHIGPQQSANFVTASFARQIALIEAGKQRPILRVGNIEASRDFLDVRDVCEAYLTLLALPPGHDQPRIFNISSGVPRQIRGLLDTLLNMTSARIEVELDPQRLRPSDIPVASGDSRRLRALTGWQPNIPIEQTLGELLDYWRRQVVSE